MGAARPSRALMVTMLIASTTLCEAAPADRAPSHKRPPAFEGARVARWLVNQNTWGTIATISNAHDSGSNGTAWANPQSFSDGIVNSTNPHEQSTGTPYFFMTGLDETPQDLMINPQGAFSISESQISGDPTCQKTDTEDPTCARISLSGTFVDVTASGNQKEEDFALRALYSRHPAMKSWGKPGKGDHAFHVWKLNVHSIFFLDFYGGAAPLTPEKYFSANPF